MLSDQTISQIAVVPFCQRDIVQKLVGRRAAGSIARAIAAS